jgi:SAM-dependent methyltransferase
MSHGTPLPSTPDSVSDAPTETVDACPLCHSPLHNTLFREPPYELRRCAACGLGYVTPRRSPTALAAMYGADTYWRSPSPKTHGYADYRAEQDRYLRTFRQRLDYALAHGPAGGRALDVGSAAGFCMAVLAERGFDVQGVEVSPVIAAHAQNELGFGERVFVGFLEDAPLPERSFDLICMWDVVEHVPDPVALLRRARTLLAPGGRLVIETQDLDSRFARVLGRRWHHFKHAEHIYHFNGSSLERLLSQSGFALERLTHRHGGKYVSAGFIAERAGRLHPALSRALTPLARRSADRDLYLNFMDEMIAVARAAAAEPGP